MRLQALARHQNEPRCKLSPTAVILWLVFGIADLLMKTLVGTKPIVSSFER